MRLTMLFEADEPKPGTAGEVTLLANGEVIGSGRIPRTVSLLYTTHAGMDIGRDNGGAVDLDYEDRSPYPFTGTVDRSSSTSTARAGGGGRVHRTNAQVGVAQGAAG